MAAKATLAANMMPLFIEAHLGQILALSPLILDYNKLKKWPQIVHISAAHQLGSAWSPLLVTKKKEGSKHSTDSVSFFFVYSRNSIFCFEETCY